MAKQPILKTPSQVAASKTKWAATHNKKRRDQYQTDPKYRDRVNSTNRSSYQKRNGAKQRTAHENVDKEETFGSVREVVREGGVTTNEITFTVREMAKLIGGYHPYRVYEWLKEEKFPRPNVRRAAYRDTESGAYVYDLPTAKQLLAVMVEHQKEKVYLAKGDTVTIEKLFNV